MYRCQLNLDTFCATKVLGISWQHLNYPNLFLRSANRFHVYFHVRIILHHFGIFLLQENGFSKVETSYIKSGYYNICNNYGVNADETWMNGDWFCTPKYGVLVIEELTQKSLN